MRTRLARVLPPGLVFVVLLASFLVTPPATTFASCSGPSLWTMPSPVLEGGGVIEVHAGAACTGGYGIPSGVGGPPLFRFWEQDPGHSWRMVQDYGSSSIYFWNIGGTPIGPNDLPVGKYNLEVDVRSQDEPSSIPYDAVANITVPILPPYSCLSVDLSISPTTPGATGGSFVMTGASQSIGGVNCNFPLYRFWVKDPGRRWSMVQNWIANGSIPCGPHNCPIATHTWGPAGTYHTGSYNLEVDVRDQNDPPSIAYDAVKNMTFTLVGCTAANLTASPPSPQGHGTAVVLTASSTCPGPQVEYRFWIFDPGRRWSMVQDFSTTNTYNCAATSTLAAGVYRLEVDVRDQGSLDVYEAVYNTTYTMS